MTKREKSEPDLAYSAHHRLRLETLVRLRWLAVAGQSVGVLVVAFVLNYEVPLAACFTLIAMSAWLNVFFLVRFPATLRLRSQFSAAQLAYDSVQLGRPSLSYWWFIQSLCVAFARPGQRVSNHLAPKVDLGAKWLGHSDYHFVGGHSICHCRGQVTNPS